MSETDLLPAPSTSASAARADLFGTPSARLQASVVIPARNEARRLPALLGALAGQRGLDGRPLAAGTVEVLVLLNNCTDGSAEAVASASARYPGLDVRPATVTLAPPDTHVGTARRILMDAAAARLASVGRPDGVVLSSDADTVPDMTWIAATLAEIEAGADAVGGRALLLAHERAALAPGVRRLYLLDLAYRRAIEEVRGLYAPQPHDPVPHHHHHFGASLAVTASAYSAVGGLPAERTSEDVALVHALWRGGRRLRHSPHVRVYTSARADGRVEGGLADAFCFWSDAVRDGREPHVEPHPDAERRLAALGLWVRENPERPVRLDLIATPGVDDGAGEPISAAIRGLRSTIARLRPMSLDGRLLHARRLLR